MEEVIVHLDGSLFETTGNNRVIVGGYAFIILVWDSKIKNYRKIVDRVGTEMWATTHRMELLAIVEAMEVLTLNPNISDYNINIFCDSKSIVDDAINDNLLETWIDNGWFNMKGIRVAEQDLWERFICLREKLPNCKYNWIRSHDGNTFNTYCDKRARGQAYHKAMEVKTKGFSRNDLRKSRGERIVYSSG